MEFLICRINSEKDNMDKKIKGLTISVSLFCDKNYN
jgi:hypothetical protein